MTIAPSQDPQARNTMPQSRNLRDNRYGGIEGVYFCTESARCAPVTKAERHRATVIMMTAKRAMKLYPPLRLTVEAGSIGEEEVCEIGVGRAFARARKASRMKEENEVKEPQKPVARPM